ncbi:MAG: hypothetical protein LAP87_23280 [Acidobacteriia bacterium]|nr:hypothetical protein [Terriglobia bacterium]
MWERERQRHYSDDQLLAYADGELGWCASLFAGRHLQRCWECRARRQELEEQARRISLAAAQSAPSGADVTRAKERFLAWKSRYERELAPRPGFRPALWAWRVAVAAATLAVILGVVRYRNSGPVPVREVLQRSQSVESTFAQAPAIHQVVDVRIRQESPERRERAGKLEVWTDTRAGRYSARFVDSAGTTRYARWQPAGGSRVFYDSGAGARIQPAVARSTGDNALLSVADADLDEIERAFLTWVGEQPWRPIELSGDMVRLSSDGAVLAARRLKTAEGSGAFEITAERQGARVKAQFTLELDAESYRPRLQVIRFERGARSVELRLAVERCDRLGEGQLEGGVFEPRLPPEVKGGPPLLPPEVERLVAPPARLPRREVLDSAEVDVWHALHGLGACLAEVVDVDLQGSRIRVRGMVGSEMRRQEVVRALSAMAAGALLEVEIAIGDPPQRGRAAALPGADSGIEAENATYAHALALVRIAEHFSAARIGSFDQRARTLLESMIQNHLEEVRRGSRQVREAFASVLENAAAPVETPPGKPAPWDAQSFALFRAADRLDTVLEATRTNASRDGDARRKTATDLRAALDSLDGRAADLHELLARQPLAVSPFAHR